MKVQLVAKIGLQLGPSLANNFVSFDLRCKDPTPQNLSNIIFGKHNNNKKVKRNTL